MSKITNDSGLTWSGTGCFIAVPIWQRWASKGWVRLSSAFISYIDHHWQCLWSVPLVICSQRGFIEKSVKKLEAEILFVNRIKARLSDWQGGAPAYCRPPTVMAAINHTGLWCGPVMAWLSGSTLVSINGVVTLHRARLVVGGVTVSG